MPHYIDDILNQFEAEKSCQYLGDTYHVRDNGSVYRCRKPNSRKRPLDEIWTFGRSHKQSGYLVLSSVTVHRIVALAFHGEQPSEKHVVDHIDTNRHNNRPENLRWVTRLENLLLNPITHSRIIKNYGSIDDFLSNPSKPIHGALKQDYDWMRTVTKEESDNARSNLIRWAKSGKLPKGGYLSDWVFSKIHQPTNLDIQKDQLIDSLTAKAIQKNWKIQSEFPNCPASTIENPLKTYCGNLKEGSVFSKNKYGESIVEQAAISENEKELFVLTKGDNVKPFALAKVAVDQEMFVHESLGSFFSLSGAQKKFTLALGIEWMRGDSIDDYC